MSSPVETLREALGTSPAQAARQGSRGINPWDGVQAGIAGWIGMTALMWVGRLAGIMPPARMDIIDLEGTFFASAYTAKAQTIGFFIHLGMSLWIAFVYILGFKWLRLRPDWRSGAFGSLVHWLIAATVVGWWSKINPQRRQQVAPGFGGFAGGPMGAIGFFIAHVVYGMLVGHVYGLWQRKSRSEGRLVDARWRVAAGEGSEEREHRRAANSRTGGGDHRRVEWYRARDGTRVCRARRFSGVGSA